MSTTGNRRPLDVARVVAASVDLADRDGLESVTMRRIADAVGVTPMALYKHVANREDLIDRMVDHVIEEIPPTAAEIGWRDAVRTRILAARRSLSSHAWAVDAIATRTAASPVVLAYMDSLMASMFDGGLPADLVHHAMHALSTRMWGFTLEVMPTPTVPDDPATRASAMSAFSASYPAIARMATTAPGAGTACDSDTEFAFALDLLLEGVARRHSEGWTSTGSSSSVR